MKILYLGLTLLLATLLLASNITFAQSPSYPRDITLCWNHPTHYVSIDGGVTPGELILDGDLAFTRLTIDRHDGVRSTDTQIVVIGLPGERQCAPLTSEIPKPGKYTAFAYAITVDGTSSDASNASERRYTGKPFPDEDLTIT